MSGAHGPMRLIVNPRAGNGRGREGLAALREQLRARGLEHDVVETTGRGHAREAARAALTEGCRYLVAVGGDGTVNEVVNGMFNERRPVAPDAVLGVFGAGTGCDFVRTFGLDRNPEVVARHLARPHTMDIDVGVARFTDRRGQEAERLFVNVAEVGYGADVVRRANRLPRRLGRMRYLLAAWATIARLDRQEATLEVDHTSKTAPLVELVVANCQFFGGGMKVAPRALPDDGRYNVLMFTGQRSQVFLFTTKLYQGEHLPHPDIVEYQSSRVEVAPPRPVTVEADGEVLGTTPASFTLLEKALRIKI